MDLGQLIGLAAQLLLVAAVLRGHSAFLAGFAQQAQHDGQTFAHGTEGPSPFDDGFTSFFGRAVLPGIVEGKVHLEAAAGHHAAAADVHQPVVLAQCLAGLASALLQGGRGVLDLAQDRRQGVDGHIGVILERGQRLALTLQLVEQVGTHFGT